MTDPWTRYRQGDATLSARRDWCKGCGLCVAACPPGLLKLDKTSRVFADDVSTCIFCGLCAERCPDFCLSLERPRAAGSRAPAERS